MKQVTLITGVAGFSARHLVQRLRQAGDGQIVGFGRQACPPSHVELDEYVAGDIRDSCQIANVVQCFRPDRVFHLAGLMNGSPSDVFDVNFGGGLNLLEAVRCNAPAARVLVVGSAAEYGKVSELPVEEDHPCRPESPYGRSKLATTLAARDYSHRGWLKVNVVRPFNLIGAGVPSSLLVGALVERAMQALGNPQQVSVAVGNVDPSRDFLAVEDAVDAYIRLLETDCWGEVFNVCSGVPSTVRSLAEELLSHAPRKLQLEIDPKLFRPADVPVVYGSSEKASRVIGFTAHTNLATSLHRAWQHATEEALLCD
jgi:GDP-4-dehydro-6-deoxy-D-mannose reductase